MSFWGYCSSDKLLYLKSFNFGPFFLCGLDECEISQPENASQSGPAITQLIKMNCKKMAYKN